MEIIHAQILKGEVTITVDISTHRCLLDQEPRSCCRPEPPSKELAVVVGEVPQLETLYRLVEAS